VIRTCRRDLYRATHAFACVTKTKTATAAAAAAAVSSRVRSRIVENTRAMRFHVASSRARLETRRLRLELVMAKFVKSLMVDLAVDRNRTVTGHGIARLHGSCLAFRSPQFVNSAVLSRRNPHVTPVSSLTRARKLLNTLFVGAIYKPREISSRNGHSWEKRDRIPTLSLTPRTNGEPKQD